MAFRFFDNDNSTTLTATQNTLIGPTALTDISGCSLTLPTAGTWLVMGTFHMRVWQSGTAYSTAQFTMQLTDSSNAVINGQSYATAASCENEQRSDVSHSFTTVIGTSGSYGIKLRGSCTLSIGTNFATGFRWDSGLGGPSVLQATRIG